MARPFELTQDFVDATAALAPSGRLDDIDAATMEPQKLARLLLIELLSWQFASPVRWIETQELLFGRVDQIIEVGLASSPTLTNLAQRSMAVAGVSLPVYNVERDQDVVMLADVTEAPAEVDDEDTASSSAAAADQASQKPEVGADAARPTENPAPMSEAGPDSAAGAPAANAAAGATESAEPAPANASASASANTAAGASTGGSAPAGELSFTAAEAIMTLFAFSNKIRLEQINGTSCSWICPLNWVFQPSTGPLMRMSPPCAAASPPQLRATARLVQYSARPSVPACASSPVPPVPSQPPSASA